MYIPNDRFFRKSRAFPIEEDRKPRRRRVPVSRLSEREAVAGTKKRAARFAEKLTWFLGVSSRFRHGRRLETKVWTYSPTP